MNKKIFTLYNFLLVLTIFLAGSQAQPRIVHEPVTEALERKNINLSARLIDPANQRVRMARIYFKDEKRENFKFVNMRQQAENWVGTIPASEVVGVRIEYFITMFLENFKVLTYPQSKANSQPLEITIVKKVTEESVAALTPQPPPTAGADVNTVVLSPEPNELLEPDQTILVISLTNLESTIEPSSVRIFLDGKNITQLAEISPYVISYTPPPLSAGTHKFAVTAKEKSGKSMQPIQVPFTIMGKQDIKKAEARLDGHIFAEGRYEEIYNEDSSFLMGGTDFNGEYGKIYYDGRLFLTSLEDGSSQPRDRFYLSVGSSFFELSAGDIYPKYNDLIIWGKRVRGIGGRLKAGLLNIEATFGETYRAIEGSSSQSQYGYTVNQYGTYRQTFLGIRPYLSFKRNGEFGLSMAKIRDDKESIKNGSNPNDNLVFGPDLKLLFDNGRIEFRAIGAFSMITRNTDSGPLTIEDIEEMTGTTYEIPFDPSQIENIFIINESTTPLDPRELTSAAYDFYLKLNYYRNLFRFGYKSIGADYFSLANSWLRTDIRGLYLSDRVHLFKNKLYLNMGFESYKDHFSESGTTPATTLNTLNFSLSYYPGKGLPNINVNFRDFYRDNGITDVQIDSLLLIGQPDTMDIREDSRQRDFSIQIGHSLNFWQADHYFNLSYIYASKTDAFDKSRLSNYYSQELSSNIGMVSWTTTYSVPFRTTFAFATNKNLMAGGDSEFAYNALSLLGEYKLLNEKLTTFLEYRWMNTTGLTLSNETLDSQRSQLRFGGIVNFTPRHILTLESNLIMINGTTTSSGSSSYTDTMIRLRYEQFL